MTLVLAQDVEALLGMLAEKDAEVERLRELAIDQHGEPYRDRFRNQMDAATEILTEVERLRGVLAAVEALLVATDRRVGEIHPALMGLDNGKVGARDLRAALTKVPE